MQGWVLWVALVGAVEAAPPRGSDLRGPLSRVRDRSGRAEHPALPRSSTRSSAQWARSVSDMIRSASLAAQPFPCLVPGDAAPQEPGRVSIVRASWIAQLTLPEPGDRPVFGLRWALGGVHHPGIVPVATCGRVGATRRVQPRRSASVPHAHGVQAREIAVETTTDLPRHRALWPAPARALVSCTPGHRKSSSGRRVPELTEHPCLSGCSPPGQPVVNRTLGVGAQRAVARRDE